MTTIGELATAFCMSPETLMLDAGRFKGLDEIPLRVRMLAERFEMYGAATEITSDDADILTAASCYWLPIVSIG